ncbi:MAG TPA: Ig-like domain-containing protein [Armatimonadota bacterium]|nr:Ig-like domain-containing protein [Armatimonadota bacterium]
MRKAAAIGMTLGFALILAAGLTISAAAGENGPSAAIASPAYSSVVVGEQVAVTVLFDAGADAEVTAAELYVDGKLHDTVTMSPAVAAGSCKLTWRCGQFAQGSHTLTARVYDSTGRSHAVDAVVALKGEAGQPGAAQLRVEIAAPAEGQEVSGPIQVRVNTDESRVRYVMLLVDDAFVALTNMPPFTYSLDTTRYVNGPHALKATAFDLGDRRHDSALVSVIVNNPGGRTEMRGQPAAALPGVELAAATAAEAAAPDAAIGSMLESAEVGSPVGPSVVAPAGAAPPAATRAEPTTVTAAPAPAQPMGAAEPTAAIASVADPAADEPLAVASAPEAALAHNVLPVGVVQVAALPPAAQVPQSAAVALAVATPAVGVQAAALAPQAPAPAAGSPVQIARAPETPTAVLAVRGERGELILHTVQPGEQLGSVSALYQVPTQEIARLNGLLTGGRLAAGQDLRIPWDSGMVLNGEPVYTDVPLVTEGGISLAPFRAIVEHSGGVVHWIPASKLVRARAFAHDIKLTMGSRVALVDAREFTLETEARLMRGRALVPLGLFRDALGLKVTLEPDRGRIYLAAQ